MNRTITLALSAIVACGATVTPSHAAISRIAPKSRPVATAAKPDSILSAYITVNPQSLNRAALDSLNVDINLEVGTLLTVRMPQAALAPLAEVKGVEYIQTASAAQPMLDIARPEVGGDLVNAGTGLSQGYTGSGVIVGIVDRGFDYGHEAFTTPDGHLRIARVWEQATQTGTPPAKFNYGTEFTSEADIINAGGDIRNNSHGTHVASIAAGSGLLRGMAPEAEIVIVGLADTDDATVNISNAIAYIFDYAESQHKPCVINLSLGTHDGPHDGTSPFDRIADSLQGPGKIIVGSAGNHRLNKFHVEGPAPTLRTCIDYRKSITTANAGGEIDIWSDSGQDITSYLMICNVNSGEITDKVQIYPGADNPEVKLGRNASGSFAVTSELNPANNKTHISLTSAITALRNNYAIAIEVTSPTQGNINIWADNNKLGLTSRNIQGFTDATASTIAEIGGTAKRIITVGAYTTRSKFTVLGVDGQQTLNETEGTLSSFSANGPTADGRTKPAITAPGCYINSAISIHDASGATPVSTAHETNGRYMTYGFMQGTSMSSPLVAGIIATWLQACPTLTPEQILDILNATARTDNFTGPINTPNNDWGSGKIDACAGLKQAIELAGIGHTAATAPQGRLTLTDNHTLDILAPAGSTLQIYNAAGHLALNRLINTPQTQIDLSNLLPGLYVARLNNSITLKFTAN